MKLGVLPDLSLARPAGRKNPASVFRLFQGAGLSARSHFTMSVYVGGLYHAGSSLRMFLRPVNRRLIPGRKLARNILGGVR